MSNSTRSQMEARRSLQFISQLWQVRSFWHTRGVTNSKQLSYLCTPIEAFKMRPPLVRGGGWEEGSSFTVFSCPEIIWGLPKMWVWERVTLSDKPKRATLIKCLWEENSYNFAIQLFVPDSALTLPVAKKRHKSCLESNTVVFGVVINASILPIRRQSGVLLSRRTEPWI